MAAYIVNYWSDFFKTRDFLHASDAADAAELERIKQEAAGNMRQMGASDADIAAMMRDVDAANKTADQRSTLQVAIDDAASGMKKSLGIPDDSTFPFGTVAIVVGLLIAVFILSQMVG